MSNKKKEKIQSVYPLSMRQAMENGEKELYFQSYAQNLHCAKAIQESISSHYDFTKWTLDKNCIYPVLQEYGYDRVCWVLANHIQMHRHDGRFEDQHKEWADRFQIPDSHRIEFLIHGEHNGLIDVFTRLVLHNAATSPIQKKGGEGE